MEAVVSSIVHSSKSGKHENKENLRKIVGHSEEMELNASWMGAKVEAEVCLRPQKMPEGLLILIRMQTEPFVHTLC